MMDFSNTLIRCSSLGDLFTDPVTKVDKEAGILSKTAKNHLIEVYAMEMWGVEKDLVTKAIKKGRQCEEDAITLMSRVDKKLYSKNDERKENEWISGWADVVEEDEILDAKVSWDAFSYLPKLIEPVDKGYFYQLQGYMWLWDKPKARISYCLVNTPQNLIEGEKYRLLRGMDVISEDSIEFKEAARRLESNMKFDQIPIELRIIHKIVERNEEIIRQIPGKVQKARAFLTELHRLHTNL